MPIVWSTSTAPVNCAVDAANNRMTYSSRGKTVSGYFYRPQGAGPFPAVLVLHTRGGLHSHEQSYASWLATQGYVALAPDYITPVGVTRQTLDPSSFFVNHTDSVREDLGRGVDCLKSLPYVVPQRIGVVGFSLGGYFTFVVATRDDVKAAVSYYGAYSGRPLNSLATQYPFGDIVAQVKAPVLMLHGDADSDVRIAIANAVQRMMVSAGKQSELVVYPGAEHAFDQEVSPYYDPKLTTDARVRTLAFLKDKLR